MPYDCVVLAKQVPDTKQVTGKAMTDQGTVNRAALPAIFNPEDLNALEMALAVKDEHGGTVTVITMGPPSACEVLRQSLYRGADRAILLTDRRFAVADTLATSYALSTAIRNLGKLDLVLCGRQAIDGDTAQVGPQTAEKLGLNQVTYVNRLIRLEDNVAEIEKSIEGGTETVRVPLPALLTVTDQANEPRPPRAKRLLQWKRASSPAELGFQARRAAQSEGRNLSPEDVEEAIAPQKDDLAKAGLLLTEWDVDAIEADPQKCGLLGSPTKVKGIESVVLTGSELVTVEPTEEAVHGLIHELIEDHILG